MSDERIVPEKITKPIQLLAAWLTGLVLLDSLFLASARFLNQPTWLPSLLVIAAIVNVPLFLVCIFLLQTKFRPEMQEDSYYSQYLGYRAGVSFHEVITREIGTLRADVTQANDQAVQLIQSLQEQTVQVTSEVKKLADTSSRPTEGLVRASEVAQEAAAEVARLRKVVQWSRTRVMLNAKLPDALELSGKLASAGVTIGGEFGKDIPKIRTIAVGPRVPPHNLAIVLAEVGDAFDAIEGAGKLHPTDILLGSYSYMKARYIPKPLTAELRDQLKAPTLTATQMLELLASESAT